MLSSDDCITTQPTSLVKSFDDTADEGFVSRSPTIRLNGDQREVTLDRINKL